MAAAVISSIGKKLMPTSEYKARKLLKSGRAEIYQYKPVFTIRLKDRREMRNSDKNERIYRGAKVRKGHVSIRKQGYPFQPGDTVMLNHVKRVVKGVHNGKNVEFMQDGKLPSLHQFQKLSCYQRKVAGISSSSKF